MTVDTVISGGTVVTTERMLDASVAIDAGRIVGVGERDVLPPAATEIDASGKLVMPGVVDPHVHIDGYLSLDSYETATSAAALGGVTSCLNFAWQAWIGELSIWETEGTVLEAIERQKRKMSESLIDVGLHASLTREDPAVFEEFDAVIDEGVTSFKIFTAYEIGLSNGFLNHVFEQVAERDAVAVLHTEDDSVCEELAARFKAEGRDDPTWYPKSRPDYAEAMAAEDAVRMATEAGAKYYGIHTSCRKAAAVLDEFRTDGSLVRAETCTHYTTLDESVYHDQGNLPIIAPPIRAPDDVEAMFEYLGQGTLSVVSTDHVAQNRADKEGGPWWDSLLGANGLQTSLPVFHDEAVNRRGFSYPFLVRVMCTNPARTFGLPGKGTIEPGTDADIVLFDPNETYTITADDNASVADYSLYEGREVIGKVTDTFVRGEPVVTDGTVVGTPGHGEYIHRELPDWNH